MFKDKRLNDVEFPDAGYWLLPESLWGKPVRKLAGQQDIDALRTELRALASALGYTWVPEGKTAAKWEKKPEPYENMRIGASVLFGNRPPGHDPVDVAVFALAKPPHNRRKGDKKKGGRK